MSDLDTWGELNKRFLQELVEAVGHRPEIIDDSNMRPFAVIPGAGSNGMPCLFVLIGPWAQPLSLENRFEELSGLPVMIVYTDVELTDDNVSEVLQTLLAEQGITVMEQDEPDIPYGTEPSAN